MSTPIKFMLEHMTCPALRELLLDLGHGGNGHAVHALCEFLRRSMPSALEFAHLSLTDMFFHRGLVVAALDLMPTLRTFSMRRSENSDEVTIVLEALAKTSDLSDPTAVFSLLPALENLEIISSLVPPLSLIGLVAARRRGHGRSLKCVKLYRCGGAARWVGITASPHTRDLRTSNHMRTSIVYLQRGRH